MDVKRYKQRYRLTFKDAINTHGTTEFLNACIPVKIVPFYFLLVEVGWGGWGDSGCAVEGTEVCV